MEGYIVHTRGIVLGLKKCEAIWMREAHPLSQIGLLTEDFAASEQIGSLKFSCENGMVSKFPDSFFLSINFQATWAT